MTNPLLQPKVEHRPNSLSDSNKADGAANEGWRQQSAEWTRRKSLQSTGEVP